MKKLKHNYLRNPDSSRQVTKFSKKAMVATSQPLAAQTGLDMIKKGGNAVDAAIATAACLTVVEPTSNGIGGDAFAIVWINNEMHGLNASGFSPKNISIKKLKQAGYDKIPKTGWIPVTVPGAVSGWVELSKKIGNLELKEVLKPAISYAQDGFPISPTLSKFWKRAFQKYKDMLKGDEFESWFDTFTIDGRPPECGEIF